ncbi:carbonic anhydrase [Streptomyces phaeochromogenes]
MNHISPDEQAARVPRFHHISKGEDELLPLVRRTPFPTLSCIDFRGPPELLFDTGLGDPFVLCTGGGVVGPVVTGSVEYGPMTSRTPLIVILGHQRCGAIKAAYGAMRDGKKLPGNLQAISGAPSA